MHRMALGIVGGLLLAVLGALVGCGGGGHQAQIPLPRGTGQAIFTLPWPEGDEARSLLVEVYAGLTPIARASVERSSDTASLAFSQLPAGHLLFRATSTTGAQGSGTVLAEARGTVAIRADSATTVTLRQGDVMTRAYLVPNTLALSVGQQARVHVFGMNAAGEVLLLPPGALGIRVEEDTATISAEGIMTAVQPGSSWYNIEGAADIFTTPGRLNVPGAVSCAGGRLLFVRPFDGFDYFPPLQMASDQGNGVYLLNTDGSGLREIIPPHAGAGMPAISPDGQAVVFVGADGDLYLLPVEGGDVRRLTASGCAQEPYFVEGGARIAFRCADGLFSVSRSGGDQRLVYRPVNPGDVVSPDLRTLATTHRVSAAIEELVLIDIANHTEKRLPIEVGPEANLGDVAFSPDGATLAFTAANAGNSGSIYLVESDGTNLRQAPFSSPAFGAPHHLVFSPDGTQLAFTVNANAQDAWWLASAADSMVLLVCDIQGGACATVLDHNVVLAGWGGGH